MSYLKINGNDTKYNVTISPFTSQHGYRALRFIGEKIPTTDKGFKYYDDNDELISDLSEYIFEYRQNEYCVQEDIIELPKGSNQPLSPSIYDKINQSINNINTQVQEITPYTETKQAYIDDTEIEFDYHVGNITAYVADGQVPCNVIVEDKKIKVSFKALEEPAKVTISIL